MGKRAIGVGETVELIVDIEDFDGKIAHEAGKRGQVATVSKVGTRRRLYVRFGQSDWLADTAYVWSSEVRRVR